jgi:hypothetical protein
LPAVNNHTSATEVNYVVDSDKSSVDDVPATINANMISFKITTNAGTIQTTRINRMTGTLDVNDSQAGALEVGTCEKAMRPKF